MPSVQYTYSVSLCEQAYEFMYKHIHMNIWKPYPDDQTFIHYILCTSTTLLYPQCYRKYEENILVIMKLNNGKTHKHSQTPYFSI